MPLPRQQSIIWAIVLAGLAATLTIAFAQSQTATTKPAAAVPINWGQHYDNRVAQFQAQNAAARNIVMVGSSHVEGFDAAVLLPGRRVLNRGISSDHIGLGARGVLHRLDSSVFDCNPGFILLENGVNDLGDLWRTGKPSIDEIEKCYRKVVEGIRARLPDVPLVVVAVFPTRDKYAGIGPSIVELNKRLKALADEAHCQYMDAHTPLADDQGHLRAEYSRDGLHLNKAGYRVWAQLIEAVLPPGPISSSQPASE